MLSSSSSDDDDDASFDIAGIVVVAVVPLGVVACMVGLFFLANRSIDEKFARDPALVGYAEDEGEGEGADYFDDEKPALRRGNMDYGDGHDESVRTRS